MSLGQGNEIQWTGSSNSYIHIALRTGSTSSYRAKQDDHLDLFVGEERRQSFAQLADIRHNCHECTLPKRAPAATVSMAILDVKPQEQRGTTSPA